jgi:hypothetical protein
VGAKSNSYTFDKVEDFHIHQKRVKTPGSHNPYISVVGDISIIGVPASQASEIRVEVESKVSAKWMADLIHIESSKNGLKIVVSATFLISELYIDLTADNQRRLHV